MQSMLRFTPASEVIAQREGQGLPVPQLEVVDALSAHAWREWERCLFAKSELQQRCLDSLRQFNGEYTPQAMANIKAYEGGSEVYMLLTQMKCRTAHAWIMQVVEDRPFACKPSPVPDLPDWLEAAIAQEAAGTMQLSMELTMMTGEINPAAMMAEKIASLRDDVIRKARGELKRRARRMEDKIDDELRQGGFYEAFNEFAWDLVIFPFAVLKGPVMRNERQLRYEPGGPGTWRPHVVTAPKRHYYAVSPFDFFPSPESRNPSEGTMNERVRLWPENLHRCIGQPGYNEQAIREVLRDYRLGRLDDWTSMETARRLAEGGTSFYVGNPKYSYLEGVIQWTRVQGYVLRDFGLDPSLAPDPDAYHDVEVILCGKRAIYARLNPDPMGNRPYSVTSFVEVRGGFAGKSPPEVIRDAQMLCNAAARAIDNNMGISSGPMVEINADRIAPGEQVTRMYPWKLFQTTSSQTNNPAVRFYQPENNADLLMRVFAFFERMADNTLGLPGYTSGSDSSTGAASTSSGLSQLVNLASRTFRDTLRNVGRAIEWTCKRTHIDLMLDPATDQNLLGDTNLVSKAIEAMAEREGQMARLNEVLAATINPIDSQIMGPLGRAELLRAVIERFDIFDVDDIIPAREDLIIQMRQAMMAAMQAPQDGSGAPGGGGSKPKAESTRPDGTKASDGAGQPARPMGQGQAGGFGGMGQLPQLMPQTLDVTPGMQVLGAAPELAMGPGQGPGGMGADPMQGLPPPDPRRQEQRQQRRMSIRRAEDGSLTVEDLG